MAQRSLRFSPLSLTHPLGTLSTWLWGGVLVLSALSFVSCKAPLWKLMRTINPYSKTQPTNLYDHSIKVSGVRLHVRKLYTTLSLACADLEADNRNGYGPAYIDPHKVQLVCNKIGTWSLTSTSASRDPMYQKMATDAYKLNRPEQLRRWSQHYFPRGTIPLRESRRGLICFQLRRKPEDPEALLTNNRCRMRLRDVRIANASVRAGWIFLEAL